MQGHHQQRLLSRTGTTCPPHAQFPVGTGRGSSLVHPPIERRRASFLFSAPADRTHRTGTEPARPMDPTAPATNQHGGTPSADSANRILDFLAGRHLFITGATGFLGKVVVEKILREQPDVGTIYLLIQQSSTQTAEQRLWQAFEAPIFDTLRAKYAGSSGAFDRFIRSKVVAVAGGLAEPNLGIKDPELLKTLTNTVNVVLNSAATTKFTERYDIAVKINTLGAQALANFAASCKHIDCHIHVSTSYTNGMRQGLVPERALQLDRSIADELAEQGLHTAPPPLSVQAEVGISRSVVLNKPSEAETSAEETDRLVKLGMERAHMFGWHDTYTFTKSMGEMLVGEVAKQASLPVAIVRPSIVESSLGGPYAGWIEGMRMADPIILNYGKGKLPGFAVNDVDKQLDLVPVDFVANAIIAAMWNTAARAGRDDVYQVASGAANPLTFRTFAEAVTEYFKRAPMLDKFNQPIKLAPFQLFCSSASFMQAAEAFAVNSLGIGTADGSRAARLQRVLQRQMEPIKQLCQLYLPYTFLDSVFGCDNVQALAGALSTEELRMFPMEVRDIQWNHYLRDVHIPGLRAYVLQEEKEEARTRWSAEEALSKL